MSMNEIFEIFQKNRIACDGRVTPTVEEWNSLAEFIAEQNAKIEELEKAVGRQAGIIEFRLGPQDLIRDHD